MLPENAELKMVPGHGLDSAPDLPGLPEQFLRLPVSIVLLFPCAACLGSAQELGRLIPPVE